MLSPSPVYDTGRLATVLVAMSVAALAGLATLACTPAATAAAATAPIAALGAPTPEVPEPAPAGAAPTGAGRSAVTLPNIVVIVADDLGHGDLSSYGGDIPTPSIDALARDGIRFTDGHVSAPVCNPSRAGLMTGRYQERWGQEMNNQTRPPDGGGPRNSLPRSETTLGMALEARGYATGAIGKWHLGMQPGFHPLDRGFDEFFGMASGSRYVERSWPGIHVFDDVPKFDPSEPRVDRTGAEESGRGLVRGRDNAPLEEYLTDQLAREGVDFIERHRAEPFFLYLAFNAPHVPLEATDEYYQRVPQFKDERKRIYAAMITALDDGVGRVLEKLSEIGAEENTLVVFVSDNGAAEYIDADGRRNAPFTGHKRNLYQGGVRLPFMMRWPERLAAGGTYSELVSTLDLMPTLLAASGAEPPAANALDGVDLLPFLTGRTTGAPHPFLFWRTAPNGAVRKGAWKLLLAREEGTGKEIVRLYDVSRDPAEARDLAKENPAVVEELRAAWQAWNEPLAEPRQSARWVVTQHAGDAIRWQI